MVGRRTAANHVMKSAMVLKIRKPFEARIQIFFKGGLRLRSPGRAPALGNHTVTLRTGLEEEQSRQKIVAPQVSDDPAEIPSRRSQSATSAALVSGDGLKVAGHIPCEPFSSTQQSDASIRVEEQRIKGHGPLKGCHNGTGDTPNGGEPFSNLLCILNRCAQKQQTRV